MIKNFKKSGKRKIQVTTKPKFMSSEDSNKKCIMIGEDTNEIIQELFDSLLHKY